VAAAATREIHQADADVDRVDRLKARDARYGAVVSTQAHAHFIRRQVSSRLYEPDGSVEMTRDPAVWTLAHRGYSGCGRLDVWVYATKQEALREGAELALACGMDEDDQAVRDFEAGRF
jgi:hypothetical protein